MFHSYNITGFLETKNRDKCLEKYVVYSFSSQLIRGKTSLRKYVTSLQDVKFTMTNKIAEYVVVA